MGYKAGQERKGILVDGKFRPPILSRGVLVGDEQVGMIKSHEHDDQTAQGINREQAGSNAAAVRFGLNALHDFFLVASVHG